MRAKMKQLLIFTALIWTNVTLAGFPKYANTQDDLLDMKIPKEISNCIWPGNGKFNLTRIDGYNQYIGTYSCVKQVAQDTFTYMDEDNPNREKKRWSTDWEYDRSRWNNGHIIETRRRLGKYFDISCYHDENIKKHWCNSKLRITQGVLSLMLDSDVGMTLKIYFEFCVSGGVLKFIKHNGSKELGYECTGGPAQVIFHTLKKILTAHLVDPSVPPRSDLPRIGEYDEKDGVIWFGKEYAGDFYAGHCTLNSCYLNFYAF
jgi:hypothetical protein